MAIKTYQVVAEFDEKKDYGIPIIPLHKDCLLLLKKDQVIASKEFLEEHSNALSRKNAPRKQKQAVFYQTMSVGKKIGMIKETKQYPIPFRDFTNLETVQYFTMQLRKDKRKNTKWDKANLSPTQKSYLYVLWSFNNWLYGREFESSRLMQTNIDQYKKVKAKTTLEGLEHFFRLYTDSHGSEPDFIRMIKRYLNDTTKHGHKKAKTMKIVHCAINAFFEKNDSPLIFKFDEKARYTTTNSEEEDPEMSLEDVLKMLTVGKPTITQKAVILSKLHRGLDTSTLIDRFNFQAWEQLVKYFGTEQHQGWDLEKCPAPIILTRIKTDYTHTGFLDVDAIRSLQDYLDYRFKKTGQPMQNGEALFLNSRNQPITDYWVRQSFKRLANTSGIQHKLKREGVVPRYQKESHELRDLLKSTLIDCGARIDVADHVIGHKPKDSYEKQSRLYPESVREQYAKASFKLNIFSNISSNMQKTANVQDLQNQVVKLTEMVNRLTQKDSVRNTILQADLKPLGISSISE